MASDYNFEKVAEQIAQDESIEKPNLEFQYTNEKGEGYMSIINALKLNGDNKSLQLIFKCAMKNEKAREVMSTRDAFVQEIIFYEEIVKTFKNFQDEYKIAEPFDNTAKCYFTTDEPLNELLVLENLKSSGYRLWRRQILMDKEHLEFALKTYAKFQATSMALRTLKPNKYFRLKAMLDRFDGKDLITISFLKIGYLQQLQRTIVDLLDVFDTKTEKVYYERLQKFGHSIEQHFNEVCAYHDDEVISQGDSWVNNLMFKYSNNEDKSVKLLDMKIIDFQYVFSRPAILDISCIFYGNASKENLDNFEYFIKLYHDSLSKHLAKFGCDINDIYPLEKLRNDWVKYSKHGLMWSLFNRVAMLGDFVKDADFTKIGPRENWMNDLFSVVNVKDEVRSQIKDLIVHCVDNNII